MQHIVIIGIMVLSVFALYEYLRTKRIIYVIGFCIIAGIAFVLLYNKNFHNNNNNEPFFVYKRNPSGFVNTGTDPPHWYERPQYRKPYRNGFMISKSAPMEHQGPLDFGPQV
jgi:hypothetical protein